MKKHKTGDKTKYSKKGFLFPIHYTLFTNLGFTYIELIVVIAVIGILSTLFVSQYPASQRRARDSERRSDIKHYQTLMELGANQNNGNYATTNNLAVSLNTCTTYFAALTTCPNDPQNSYFMISTPTRYVIWATLEQPPTPTTYFVVCSNGRSGETITMPVPATPCPL